MKKFVLFQMLIIVTLLSLFVTSCEKEPKNSDSVTIESTDLPKSSGVDIFAGKMISGKAAGYLDFKYEFDNEGNVIYAEKYNLGGLNSDLCEKVAKYKYAFREKNEKKGIYYNEIHFKPIGFYIDDVLYTDSDEYANKLVADIKNNSISVSDDYAEILKKIWKYTFTSTKIIKHYTYDPEDKSHNFNFAPDISIRNISNVLNTAGTDISEQLILEYPFKTKLGVTSTICGFVFMDKSGKNTYKELNFQIYECTKNKAKVVYTYLDQTTGGEDNSESHAEYKVAGYGKVTVDYKTEWIPIPSTNTKRQENYAKVKITDVDDNLKAYLTKELADITGTGDGLPVSSILDKEFLISLPSLGSGLDYGWGNLK